MNRSNLASKVGGFRYLQRFLTLYMILTLLDCQISASLATDDQVEPRSRRVAQTTGKSITQIPGTSTGFLEKIFLFGNFFFTQPFAYARAP